MRVPSGDQRGSTFTAPLLDQRGVLAGREVEQPQLHRVVPVGRVDDAPAVGRPVGLMVVSRAGGELARLVAAEPLAPQPPLHGVDQLRPVRRPARGGGPARHLGDVHLAPVVGVGDADLLQHALALRRRGRYGRRPPPTSDRGARPTGARRRARARASASRQRAPRDARTLAPAAPQPHARARPAPLGSGVRNWTFISTRERGLVAVHRRVADRVHDLHAGDDLAEDRVLALQRRLVGHADEELAAAAVRRRRAGARRPPTPRVNGPVRELRLQQAQPAGSVARRLLAGPWRADRRPG